MLPFTSYFAKDDLLIFIVATEYLWLFLFLKKLLVALYSLTLCLKPL